MEEEELIAVPGSYFKFLINLASAENESDNSNDQVPVPVNVSNPDKSIVIEREIDLNDSGETTNKESSSKKSPSKKNRKSRIERPSTSSERERSPHFGCCPICLEPLRSCSMASTKCGHVYCIKCIERVVRREKKCPTCRKSLRGPTAIHPLFL